MGIWVKRGLAILIAGGIVFLVATRVFEAREDAARAKTRRQGWGGGRVVNVDLAQAWTGAVSDVLLLTGALKPKEQVDVTSKATGRVESIRFRVGDRIGAGALVAELEDDELRQQVHRAEAAIAVARASYSQRRAEHDNARAELERAESLSLRREQHYSVREAVITAGSRRLRPILMTTITTVLGLTPMALGIGEGGELQAPLARVVIGGLCTSTLITLVFIPVVYMTLEERAERAKARQPPLAQPVESAGD